MNDSSDAPANTTQGSSNKNIDAAPVLATPLPAVKVEQPTTEQHPIATTSPTTRASTAAAAASNKKASANHDGNAPSNPQANPRITDLDVLVGRGKGAYMSAGNLKFQELVNAQLPDYKRANKNKDKIAITNRIVQAVHNYGGRFLKEEGLQGQVSVIDDRQARIKVAQALRRRRRIDEHGIDQSSSYHPERRRMRKQQQQQQTTAREQNMQEQQKQMQDQYRYHQPADIAAARAEATAAAAQHRRQQQQLASTIPTGFPIPPSNLVGATMDIPPQHPVGTTNTNNTGPPTAKRLKKAPGDDDIMDAGRALFALSGSSSQKGEEEDAPSWLQQQRADFQQKLLQYQANGMPPKEINALAQKQQELWAQQQEQFMTTAANDGASVAKIKNEETSTTNNAPPKKRRSPRSKDPAEPTVDDLETTRNTAIV